MDDIFIEIPSMQSKASQLQALSGKINSVADILADVKSHMSNVWEDEGFSEFEADFANIINKLIDLQSSVDSMAAVCTQACNEYQTADNKIMSLI